MVAAGVENAARALAEAGYAIEKIELPLVEESAQVVKRLIDTEVRSYLPVMRTMISEDAATVLDSFVGDTVPDLHAYMKAIAKRHAIAREWSLFMQRYPLVLGPVSTQPAFEVGHDLTGTENALAFIRSIALTKICSLLGLPSVALPVGVSGGLPRACSSSRRAATRSGASMPRRPWKRDWGCSPLSILTLSPHDRNARSRVIARCPE